MKRLLPTATILAALIAPGVAADSLKKGALGCLSESLFDQLIIAITNKDQRAVRYLLAAGCLKTNQAAPVTVLDAGIFSGKSKVRAYAGGSAVELWVFTEDIVSRDVPEPRQQQEEQSGQRLQRGDSGQFEGLRPYAPYFDPRTGSEHSVQRYTTMDGKQGFEFDPPLARQDDVLMEVAEWIILGHYRDSEVSETVRFFSGGDLMFVRAGRKYRIQIVPRTGDNVVYLLFEKL